MQRDYEVAAIMAAALRSTLAHMKLHRPLDEVYSPFHTDASHPASRGFCDADSAAHDPRYGVGGMQAYRETLLRINLQHAPVVCFRYVGTGADISPSVVASIYMQPFHRLRPTLHRPAVPRRLGLSSTSITAATPGWSTSLRPIPGPPSAPGRATSRQQTG
jgi:hypothetical protein